MTREHILKAFQHIAERQADAHLSAEKAQQPAEIQADRTSLQSGVDRYLQALQFELRFWVGVYGDDYGGLEEELTGILNSFLRELE